MLGKVLLMAWHVTVCTAVGAVSAGLSGVAHHMATASAR